jgi:SUMO ligase MMS21 Smc5/6 complex component
MAHGIDNLSGTIKRNMKNLQDLRVSLHQGKQSSELCIVSQNIEISTTRIGRSIWKCLQIYWTQVREKGRERERGREGGNLRKQVQWISIGSRRWNSRLC